MYIFLGLLVEVGTIICSKAIDVHSVSKELDKLAKDGYKLDSDRLKKYGEELKRNAMRRWYMALPKYSKESTYLYHIITSRS